MEADVVADPVVIVGGDLEVMGTVLRIIAELLERNRLASHKAPVSVVPVIGWANSMPEISIISPSAATRGGVGSRIHGPARSDQPEWPLVSSGRCPSEGRSGAGAASSQGPGLPDPAFVNKMRR